MFRIRGAPNAVSLVPAFLRNTRSAVNRVPVRRIVALQFCKSPIQSHGAEQIKVSLRIGVVGIDQRAIPIKEHAGEGVFGGHLDSLANSSTAGGRESEIAERHSVDGIAAGDVIVAVEGEIFKFRSESEPAGHVGGLTAANARFG